MSNETADSTIRRTEYTSGVRLITERMPAVRSVTLGFWVTAGSRDEAPRIAGASHFLEHLLFKGTRKRSARDIAEAFDAVGGDLNAYTAKENTTFYSRVLDRDVGMAVEHLCDMLLDSQIRAVDLDAERQVILEEISMHEDSPDELVHDLFTENLWGEHPLGRPVLGTVRTISAMSRDQIRRFWKRHYQPGRFVVVAAGNVDHDHVAGLLADSFELGEPAPESRSRLRDAGDAPKAFGRSEVRRRTTEQAHICLGTSGLSRSDPRRFAFGLVNSALGGGMSSRLFQEVREKRGLVYSVFSYHQMYAETGLFTVYAGTTPARATEVLEIITRELEEVAEKGLTGDELDRAKSHMKGSLALSLEDTGGRMSRLGKSEIGHGEILSIDQIFERIDSVTAEDAKGVGEAVLSRPRAVTVIGPFDEGTFESFAGMSA
ncbi:MAG TPA: pitrilysin family protein [Actinomycetota bacterium]|jgi:predicted Zn-dependent peptidase|nr:pitrilysin family protein [Actinomycetota bacterium]